MAVELIERHPVTGADRTKLQRADCEIICRVVHRKKMEELEIKSWGGY